MISIDKSIQWKAEYKRNHRSKYQKRLRCFPSHSEGGHQECGFCGQSVTINTNIPTNDENNYIVVGKFGRFPNEDKARIKVGDELKLKSFRYKDNVESPFYSSTPIISNNSLNYVINSGLNPWRYSAPIYNRQQLNSFYIYLFKKIDTSETDETSNVYKCIEIINAPPFSLSTNLKIKKDMSIEENEVKSDEDHNSCIMSPQLSEDIERKRTEETVEVNQNDEIKETNSHYQFPHYRIEDIENYEHFNIGRNYCLFPPQLTTSLPVLPPLPPISPSSPTSSNQKEEKQKEDEKRSSNLLCVNDNLSVNDNTVKSESNVSKLNHNNNVNNVNNNEFNEIIYEQSIYDSLDPISPSEPPPPISERIIVNTKPVNLDNSCEYTYLKMKNQNDQSKEEDLCRFLKTNLKTIKRSEIDPFGRSVNSPKFLFEKPPICQIDSKGNMRQVNPYPKDIRFSDKH